jgi:hypothetical protein
VQLVLSITTPSDGAEGVFYFGTPLSTSEAGRAVASHLATRLGIERLPRAVPILKETRSPAVVIVVSDPPAGLGTEIGRAVIDLYANGPDDA